MRNPRVECEFQCEIPFSDVPLSDVPFGPLDLCLCQRPLLFFWSGGFPFRQLELKRSLVATSLKVFSVTGHKRRVPEAPFKGITRVRGAPPALKNQSGHIKSGLEWPADRRKALRAILECYLSSLFACIDPLRKSHRQ